jgi:hypothetical protein
VLSKGKGIKKDTIKGEETLDMIMKVMKPAKKDTKFKAKKATTKSDSLKQLEEVKEIKPKITKSKKPPAKRLDKITRLFNDYS